MSSDVIGLLIEFSAHVVLLTVVLWIMIKLQGLNYNFSGLAGSAILGGGLDMIPHFGHLLAVPVLYFCIWKLTRASMFPDAAFTVAVAYALMFAFNMFLLTALIGDLRPDLRPPGSDTGTNLLGTTLQDTNPKPPAIKESAAERAAEKAAKELPIKAVTRNGDQSSVDIQVGAKIYFVPLNKLTLIQVDDTILKVQLTALGDTTATLEIGGEPVNVLLP
jgi:hypothetical protein